MGARVRAASAGWLVAMIHWGYVGLGGGRRRPASCGNHSNLNGSSWSLARSCHWLLLVENIVRFSHKLIQAFQGNPTNLRCVALWPSQHLQWAAIGPCDSRPRRALANAMQMCFALHCIRISAHSFGRQSLCLRAARAQTLWQNRISHAHKARTALCIHCEALRCELAGSQSEPDTQRQRQPASGIAHTYT